MEPVTNVVVREVLDNDLSVFFDHQRDPIATEMAAFPTRDRDAFMKHWKGILRDPTVVTRTILADGKVAGNVVHFERDGRLEVGYWIGREYWGRGVATNALREFLRQVDARPLFAGVAKHNTASIRVLEKCGFVVVEEIPAFSAVGDGMIEGFMMRLDK